jgi:hypothetical protein
MTWSYEPNALAALLEAAGFDVDRTAADMIGGGSLTARRDRADRTTILVVDAGGRLRIDLTTRLSERAAPLGLTGLRLHGVETTVRTWTLTGQATEKEAVARLLAELDRLDRSEKHAPPDRAGCSDGPG